MTTSFPAPNIYSTACPTRQILDVIADKWTTLVMGLLVEQPQRFAPLHRAIEGISQKMLTQTLRRLERDGLISRTVYAAVPPHVEYALTPLGVTLMPIITAIREWAESHIDAVTQAQQDYDASRA